VEPDRLEIEIKYEIDELTYDKILSHFAGSHTAPKHQKNVFFDTKENELLVSSWVLRLRQEDERSFLTVKGNASVSGLIHTRTEFEEEIPSDLAQKLITGFSLSDCELLPCKKLIEYAGALFVTPFLSFENSRIEIAWEGCTIELDRFEIGDRVFFELEVEAASDKIKELEVRLQMLFSANGWIFSPSGASKFQRALYYHYLNLEHQ
jgi:inorganic triphosphatase YgiF